jgi:hypothetical protein
MHLSSEIDRKFDVSDVKDSEGVTIKYLSYHFKGFPAVASIAKLSAWQNVKKQNLTFIAAQEKLPGYRH